MAKTLYDKIWESHLVDEQNDGTSLLYIDRHLVHEVTSPQAFEGLRLSNRKVKLPGSTLAVVDHNVPTTDRSKGIADKESAIQVETLSKNCKDFGIEFFGLTDKRQGIVHVIGPEQGFTQPGMTIVCGDSHTSTHGAFGALAFGIGTSEVEHVLIEAGARAGLVAPDQKTFDYIKGRPLAPKGENWEKALKYWSTLYTDKDAKFDRELHLQGKDIEPTVTWGTSPQDTASINGKVPDPNLEKNEDRKKSILRSLDYMGLEPNTAIQDIKIDKVFIGSCTNGRIEDLREVAKIVKGKKVNKSVDAIVVPGSGLVKLQAEKEGLDKIFKESGFDWREPGCSMCLGMNPDQLKPKERCASTSNRNFEGRQGRGGRTHLVSPVMAAAAAIEGKFVDIRKII